jgi:hypothetical protein
VFGVAGFAAGGIVETAVQPLAIGSLFGDGGMANFAAVGRNPLPGGVTLAAASFKLSVVVEAL